MQTYICPVIEIEPFTYIYIHIFKTTLLCVRAQYRQQLCPVGNASILSTVYMQT